MHYSGHFQDFLPERNFSIICIPQSIYLISSSNCRTLIFNFSEKGVILQMNHETVVIDLLNYERGLRCSRYEFLSWHLWLSVLLVFFLEIWKDQRILKTKCDISSLFEIVHSYFAAIIRKALMISTYIKRNGKIA